MRRGMYILPSMFTAANVLLGFFAILQVIHGTIAHAIALATHTAMQAPPHFDNAAKAIGFAVLFDGLDGRIARMTGTTSDFGRELDSLADGITFGIAPALLAWAWGFSKIGNGSPNPDLLVTLGRAGAVAAVGSGTLGFRHHLVISACLLLHSPCCHLLHVLHLLQRPLASHHQLRRVPRFQIVVADW